MKLARSGKPRIKRLRKRKPPDFPPSSPAIHAKERVKSVQKPATTPHNRETLLKTIFDAIDTPIVVVNRHGVIIDSNAAWERTKNTESSRCLMPHMPGSNYLKMCERARLAHRDGAEEVIPAVTGVLRGRLSDASVEYWRQGSDGQDQWFSLTVTPLPDGAGALLLHEEITQRKLIKRQIIASAERERRWIGQELHDTVCQQLMGASMLARGLGDTLARSDAEAGAKVLELSDVVQSAVDQIRTIARGLHPVTLDTGGLVAALKELATQTYERVPCRLICDRDVTIRDEETASNLYRIAQEAVTNAVKHAAPTNITITLRQSSTHLMLSVEDDGVGFPPETETAKGMGLHIMKYRAGTIGARLDNGNHPKRGAWIRCIIPINALL